MAESPHEGLAGHSSPCTAAHKASATMGLGWTDFVVLSSPLLFPSSPTLSLLNVSFFSSRFVFLRYRVLTSDPTHPFRFGSASSLESIIFLYAVCICSSPLPVHPLPLFSSVTPPTLSRRVWAWSCLRILPVKREFFPPPVWLCFWSDTRNKR